MDRLTSQINKVLIIVALFGTNNLMHARDPFSVNAYAKKRFSFYDFRFAFDQPFMRPTFQTF